MDIHIIEDTYRRFHASFKSEMIGQLFVREKKSRSITSLTKDIWLQFLSLSQILYKKGPTFNVTSHDFSSNHHPFFTHFLIDRISVWIIIPGDRLKINRKYSLGKKNMVKRLFHQFRNICEMVPDIV